MGMVESHSRGGATDTDSGCPDKYVPDIKREIDRTDYGTVYFGLSFHGYERWEHKHISDQWSVVVHRLMAVAEWGFDAVAGNIVHHKNNNSWDNRTSNLEIKSQSEHVKEHFSEGSYGRSKLTNEQVKRLRKEYTGDRTFAEIAEGTPFSKEMVRNAIRGNTFEWVDEPPVEGDGIKGPTKLTKEEVIEIRERYEPYVVTRKELADDYGVAVSTIQSIVDGSTYQGIEP